MSRLGKLLHHLRRREYRYIFKRVVPDDNPVFFAGRQLIFGLQDRHKLREVYDRAARLVKYDVHCATGPHRQRLLDAFPEHASRFARRFEQGAICYIALSKDEVAGYLWIQRPAAEYRTNNLLPFKPEPPGGYWYFDAYVLPQYRMKGVFPYLLGTVDRMRDPADQKQLFGETAYNNQPSIRSHMLLGYRRVRTVDFVTLLGLRLYLVRDHDTGRRTLRSRFALDPASRKL